ncbi:MAG: 4-hydroxy-3-methylbut-2-enyl diphosphate reductase [Planctomycetes bacterium]|nr:4-hydroxy-3-methylbut-2-enyl diphosphate reductase [Planctomycetota bacterium]
MRITLAAALGTCFGVRDAIDAAMDESFRNNLTIVGELVHNPQVIAELRAHGVDMVKSIDEPISTANVMITAHGAPASMRQTLEARGFHVFDASCPLVIKVHNKVASLVRDGFFPVVVGQRDHVEVRGIVGDLAEYDLILDESDLDRLAGRDRIGIVCQTTQQLETAERLVRALEQRFPEAQVRFVDTICKPTKDRQRAVRELAEQVDLMVVVGGKNSSNTKKLKKVCDDRGVEAYHITGPEELHRSWFVGKEHVGITAGTSTPHAIIDMVAKAIEQMTQMTTGPGDR